MFTVNFAVGSTDDARLAADVCDFLAERMAAGTEIGLERCRAIAKARGGKWLGDTMKKLAITNSMSTWTAEQQEAFFAEDALQA